MHVFKKITKWIIENQIHLGNFLISFFLFVLRSLLLLLNIFLIVVKLINIFIKRLVHRAKETLSRWKSKILPWMRIHSSSFKNRLRILVDRSKKIPRDIFKTFVRTFLFLTGLPFRLLRALLRSSVFLFFLGSFSTLVLVIVPLEVYRIARELPDPGVLIEKGTRSTTKILDRNGKLLYEIYEDRKYDPVALDQVPSHMIDATIAIEDAYFYEHDGFRLESMARAAKVYITENRVQGASTITQQLIKNVLLTPDRTIYRKVRELMLAVMVENKYSKDEILELYLNNISYGGIAWGVEPAAQKYFGKSVTDLDLAEASLLAGLPSAPSIYSPLMGNWDLMKNRQRQVLERMVALEMISEEDSWEAYERELNIAEQRDVIRAPHFVFYVRSLLEEMYGSRTVLFGGLTVRTTLDLDLHDEVQKIVTEGVREGYNFGFTNGAAVILESETGGILAYVGSINFFQEGWGAFDVVSSERQPGSAIKPVTYSLALSMGLTPSTVISDSPVSYPQPGQPPYRPMNFDRRFRGNVTLRQALAQSLNVPAVKLVDSLGPENMVILAREMGIKNWDPEAFYGLAVTLGSKETSLLELTNAFGTLSRQGYYMPTDPILSVRDIQGRVLYEGPEASPDKVLNEGVAFLVSNILSDNNSRAPAFGYSSHLNIPGRIVAVKTGTSDDRRDNWTVGYTPTYTVGVWVGNNDNSPVRSMGATGAAPIWNSIMTTLLEDRPEETFEVPDNIILKFDEECDRGEYFIRGTNIPETLCPPKEDNEDDNGNNNNNN